MPLELWAMALALLANVVLGVGLVVGVYSLMEQRVVYGSVGGLVIGAAVVYAEATLGARLFDLAFEDKRLLIVVAGVGAALGIVGTLSIAKPEIE
ncbi:MAG: hypothetical protein ABEJ40_05765 [Haloarculaceae archaeon]